jgi:hypothetical protein
MSVTKGLPSELKMDMVSLPDSVTSYAVKVVPQNLSSIVSNTVTINPTVFSAASKVAQITMPSQQINFDIPSGQNRNTWIDTAKSTISFRVNYNRVEGATAIGDCMQARLIHNAYNFFNRLFHTSATGTIPDDVPLSNLAYTTYLQNNLNASDVDSVALAYGFNSESGTSTSANSINQNTGHSIAGWSASQTAGATADYWYSYELPLPSSVFGCFARGMFPIGSVSKLTMSLVTDSIAPVVIQSTSAATASSSSVLKLTISDIALNLSYVDLGDAGSALLGGSGTKICSGITHRVSSTTIPAEATGAISSLMGLRGSSVRSLCTKFVENLVDPSGCANDKFDSKLPLATGMNYFLQGSTRVPPYPLDAIRAPSSVFMRALQASNAFNERQYKNAGTPQTFCVYVEPKTAGDLTAITDRDRYLASSNTGYNFLANFEFAMNLQKVSKSKILDGMNFNTSNQYLEMNIAVKQARSITLYHIAELDVIYVITPDGDIQARL